MQSFSRGGSTDQRGSGNGKTNVTISETDGVVWKQRKYGPSCCKAIAEAVEANMKQDMRCNRKKSKGPLGKTTKICGKYNYNIAETNAERAGKRRVLQRQSGRADGIELSQRKQ